MEMKDKLSETLGKILPGELGEDIKKNVSAVVSSNLEKMNLVTVEQMEIQQKILQRTRDRVEQLERQVAELEKRLQERS